jgi:hypothetical protein
MSNAQRYDFDDAHIDAFHPGPDSYAAPEPLSLEEMIATVERRIIDKALASPVMTTDAVTLMQLRLLQQEG